MPRHRHTFALILISFAILATVITAFRVRDLPKSDLKPSARRQKCEDCSDSELELDKKTHSFRVDNAKRVYQDLKKAVREKQKQINLRSPEFKFEFSHEDDDDDDDDDDEELNIKVNKNIKEKISSQKLVSREHESKEIKVDDTDDNDGNDDDYDDDKELKIKIKDIKEKKVPPKLVSREHKYKETKLDNNDDEDEDNDDEDDDDNDDDDIVKLSTKAKSKGKNQKSQIIQTPIEKTDKKSGPPVSRFTKDISKKSKVIAKDDDDDDDNDDNDDDDEDDEENDYVDIKKNKISKKPKESNKALTDKKQVNDDNKINKDDLKVKNKVPKKSEESQKAKESKPVIIEKKQSQDDDDDETGDGKRSLPDRKKEKEETTSPQSTITKDATKPTELDHSKDKIVKKSHQKDIIVKDELTKQIPSHQKSSDKPSDIKPLIKKEIKQDTEKDSKKDKKGDTKDKAVEHKLKKEESKESKPRPDKPSEDVKKSKHEPDTKKKDDSSKEKSSEKKHYKVESRESEEIEDIVQRHEAYLKLVTEALHRRNLLQSEFEDFYAFFPTFAPNFSRIHNPECRRHGQILLRQLRGTKLWALNMLDSTAKIPSGILQGNSIQLGDFDQCLGSHARVQLETGSIVRVQGKYCLARIDIKAETAELEVPVHLAQAKNLFKSRIDDPGHFVPRFSTLSWGVCVPAACNPEDVEVVIRDTVKHYQHTSGIVIRVKVDEQDCHVEETADWWEKWMETPTIVTLSLYAIVILLVLIATINDFLSRSGGDEPAVDEDGEGELKDDGEEKADVKEKQSDGVISSFSLYRTITKLTAPGDSDDIACIHGVRGLATIALLVAHKTLPVAVTPYTNRVKITEIVSSALWSWARAGWVFTDCFLLLSGVLTAFKITPESSALKRIVSRYLRLTPALLAVVLYYAYVWDYTSSGPMWGTLVSKNAEVCQEGWWWNMLYVQNHFGFEDMCAPQTHQLALDMQLTFLGGIVVWCLQTKFGASTVGLLLLHALTAYSRYTTVKDHRLTLLVYHGVSVSQLYRTARLTYTSTLHRSTAYLVGLSLGLALQKPVQHGKIVKTLGWLVSIALWSLVWWAGHDSGYTTYHYSASFAAQYAALAPIASSLAIAWMIYAVHNGGEGVLSRFLCCQPLVFISRLSYAVYLCQFAVYLTNAGTVRTSTEFTLIGLLDIQEISNILLSSTILSLTFVIPMQSLNKFKFTLFSKSEGDDEPGGKNEDESNEEKPVENGIKTEQEVDGVVELPQIRRSHLLAHREVLEEIPEVEIEYEMQRDHNDGLEEIIEEEEDEEATDRDLENPLDEEEDIQILDDDMEIIEEEPEEGGEDFWVERDEVRPRRSFRFDDDDDEPDEYEHSANRSSNGAQHYRYTR